VLFLFQLSSVLLIGITFYTYLADIVFSFDLAFKALWDSYFTVSFSHNVGLWPAVFMGWKSSWFEKLQFSDRQMQIFDGEDHVYSDF